MSYLETLPRAASSRVYLPLLRLRRSCCCSRSTGWRSRRSSRTSELLVARRQSVLGRSPDASRTSRSCCSTPPIRSWLWNTMLVSVVVDLPLAGRERARRLRDRAAALPRLALGRAARSSSPTWCRRRSCSFRSRRSSSSSACSTRRWALILTYPTFLIPFCTWLLMGYFRSIPYELEECALIDGATRWQILIKIVCRWRCPG